MKKLWLGAVLCSGAVWAADAPALKPNEPQPELNLQVAEPPVLGVKTDGAPASKPSEEKVIQVDAATLAQDTELLQRAMFSAVVAYNIGGIEVVLPIYEQWPQHDRAMALYARALLKQAKGEAGEAVRLYREFIAETPDAPAVRLQLAKALYEDKQNEAAADQFNRLQSENLPDDVKQQVEAYRQALRERDSWQWNASFNLTREQNINQAPRRQRLGEQLSEAQCEVARRIQPDDDCFRGWTFNAPIDAVAAHYQLGGDKKWSLPQAWYATAGAGVHGKVYRGHSQYNDATTRISAGVGRADQRSDWGATPFHERRFYGNDAYSYTNGLRLHYNRWHTPNLQSLSALEFGRLKNQARSRANSQSRLLSTSLLYYPNARQYWLLGGDLYLERNQDDRSENFNRYGVRAAWGQEWKGGLSTRVQLNGAHRRYATPSFFSNQAKRRDNELGTTLSVWHRAVHFQGITPRLTLSHQLNRSNDAFYEYGKSRAFVELSKTF